MRRLILALALVAEGAAGGFLVGQGRPNRIERAPVPPASEVRTIAIHAPDPDHPGQRRYHVLRVFAIATQSGTARIGEPTEDNWLVSTFPGDAPTGHGQVTYSAATVRP